MILKDQLISYDGKEIPLFMLLDEVDRINSVDYEMFGRIYGKEFQYISMSMSHKINNLKYSYTLRVLSCDIEILNNSHGNDLKEIINENYSIVPTTMIRFDENGHIVDYKIINIDIRIH